MRRANQITDITLNRKAN